MYPYNACGDDHHLRKIMSTKKNTAHVEDRQEGAEGKSKKTCFVVAPIGSEGTDIRRSTEGLLKAVLKPVLDKFGYDVVIAHEISTLGSITEQVVNHLLEAELVVADLTGLNPNVMYELAIRHCAALPVVVVANKNTKLPFDVVVERTIFYSDDMHGGVDLARELEKIIIKIQESDTVADNPVSRAKRAESVREKLMSKADVGDVGKYLLEKIDKLEYLVNGISINNEKLNLRNRWDSHRKPNDRTSEIGDVARKLTNMGIPVRMVSRDLDSDIKKIGIELTREITPEESDVIEKIMLDLNVGAYTISGAGD